MAAEKVLDSQIKCSVVSVPQYAKKLSDHKFMQNVDFKKSQRVKSKMCDIIVRFVQDVLKNKQKKIIDFKPITRKVLAILNA